MSVGKANGTASKGEQLAHALLRNEHGFLCARLEEVEAKIRALKQRKTDLEMQLHHNEKQWR